MVKGLVTKDDMKRLSQLKEDLMSYKTILVNINSSKSCVIRVEVAINLAMQHDAHLVALHTLAPFAPPSYAMVHMGPEITEIIKAQENAVAAEIARAKADFIKQTSTSGIRNGEWRTTIDDPVDAMSLHARYADIVVIGQADSSDGSEIAVDFPARLVLAAGRPVLIVPNAGSFDSTGKRILIAWNGSREATQAVTDAIPLLKLADNVNVMAVNPRHGEHGSVPGADLGTYLARHGVHVDVMTNPGDELDVGNELLSRAADLSADLIVMGGYGHSRVREWILGGATRTILESMTIPVLMSH